jgi:hypothetical protein
VERAWGARWDFILLIHLKISSHQSFAINQYFQFMGTLIVFPRSKISKSLLARKVLGLAAV